MSRLQLTKGIANTWYWDCPDGRPDDDSVLLNFWTSASERLADTSADEVGVLSDVDFDLAVDAAARARLLKLTLGQGEDLSEVTLNRPYWLIHERGQLERVVVIGKGTDEVDLADPLKAGAASGTGALRDGRVTFELSATACAAVERGCRVYISYEINTVAHSAFAFFDIVTQPFVCPVTEDDVERLYATYGEYLRDWIAHRRRVAGAVDALDVHCRSLGRYLDLYKDTEQLSHLIAVMVVLAYERGQREPRKDAVEYWEREYLAGLERLRDGSVWYDSDDDDTVDTAETTTASSSLSMDGLVGRIPYGWVS